MLEKYLGKNADMVVIGAIGAVLALIGCAFGLPSWLMGAGIAIVTPYLLKPVKGYIGKAEQKITKSDKIEDADIVVEEEVIVEKNTPKATSKASTKKPTK